MKLAELNAAGGIVEYRKAASDEGWYIVRLHGASVALDAHKFERLFTPLPEDESEKAN